MKKDALPITELQIKALRQDKKISAETYVMALKGKGKGHAEAMAKCTEVLNASQHQVAKFIAEVDAFQQRWEDETTMTKRSKARTVRWHEAIESLPLVATKKLLVGRTITDFKLGAFPNGRGGKAYNPIITLDNGARLMFDVTETESGEYGVTPTYYPKKGS